MIQAVVVLAPGFEEIEAITQIDVLRRAGVDVLTASVGELGVRGAHAIVVQADVTLENVPEAVDAVILPGGMPGSKTLGESASVRALVRRVHEAGGVVAAICAAPAMALSPTGVLVGKRVTCYPGFEKHFPEGAVASEDRVVVDGSLITSRGPGTALEFALTLVTNLVGAEKAAELRAGMLVV